jgi:hypothetical protein
VKNGLTFSLLLMAAISCGSAQAVYKCTTASGVSYQQFPCTEGVEAKPVVEDNGTGAKFAAPAAASPSSPVQGNAGRSMGPASAGYAVPTSGGPQSTQQPQARKPMTGYVEEAARDKEIRGLAPSGSKIKPTASSPWGQ